MAICKTNKVQGLPQDILENFWLKQLLSVDKPVKANFSPSSEGRGITNYCGIKNLGAVCYMNSMNQQCPPLN